MDDAVGSRLPRRRLLGALLAGAAIGGGLGATLSGCGPQPSGNATGPADRSPVVGPTYSDLVADRPFYIAHRGGGSDWPEMTAYAYQEAAKVPGLKAMEVSVCLSRDGVLVCSHDPNTLRVTGVSAVIADNDWATLSKLRVSAENTVDPSQPSRPLARIEEIVPQFIDDFVLFVEPETSSADLPLMKLTAGLNQPQRVVWKQPINSRRFTSAQEERLSHLGLRTERAGPSRCQSDPVRSRSGHRPARRSADLIRGVHQCGRPGGSRQSQIHY